MEITKRTGRATRGLGGDVRAIACVLLSMTMLASVARAQSEASPVPEEPLPSYAVLGTMEMLLFPLVTAAERDLAAGRPELAVLRASLAMEVLHTSSPLRDRAAATREAAVASSRGAGGAAPSDLVLEPLVTAAERDLASGQTALGNARLDFVLPRVPAISALGQRAAALRAGRASVPPTAVVDQMGEFGEPASPAGPARETSSPRVGGASRAPSTPSASTARPPAQPAGPPPDPTRRGDGELAELYITGTALGAYTGFFVPFAAGLAGQARDQDLASLVYALTIVGGGGLFALGVAGLDSIGGGLRTGVGPAISMGVRYGIATGLLMWGALDPALSTVTHGMCGTEMFTCSYNRAGLMERTSLPMAFGIGGGLLGAAIGFGLRPSVEQVRVVEVGGLWGTLVGLLASGGAAEDNAQGFVITASGMGLGMLGTSIALAAGARIGPGRVGFMSLGLAGGAAVGMLVPLIASGITGGWSWPFFTITSATGIAGLVLAGVLTDGMNEGGSGPDVRVSASPLEGGGVLDVSGTF